MINLHDLRAVTMMANLSDGMLRKIQKITVTKSYQQGQFIFREGDYAEFLYAVRTGKVGLEMVANNAIPFRVLDIYPGKLFGISAIINTDQRTVISNAKVLKDTTVFCWRGGDLEKLFFEDYHLGFLFMRSIGKILKMRSTALRGQLVEACAHQLQEEREVLCSA